MQDQVVPAVQYQQNAPTGFAPDNTGQINSINTGDPISGTPILNSDPSALGFDANVNLSVIPTHLTLMDLVEMAIGYAFILAFALSAVFIFWGGISFILSGGNDEKIKQSVNTIRYSIIGLVVTILSFTFVQIVGRIFGLNFLEYLSFDRLKGSVEKIFETNGSGRPNDFTIQR